MLLQKTISIHPFSLWLWQDRENKSILYVLIPLIAISFIWLKSIYPYPNFMPPDSFSYIEAAHNKDTINIWPIGYSFFLRLTNFFSNSHLFLAIIQYSIIQLSLLYFLFTARYLMAPGKWLFRISAAMIILNPLIPHISNFVSSDCLFTSLSLIWFTHLLWIIYKPSVYILITHAIILLLAFTVRHNALFYPFISFFIIMLSSIHNRIKYFSISFIITLLLSFVGLTQHQYYKKTNRVQYSAFGGWQIAANALYGYAFSNPEPLNKVPKKYKELHTVVNRHLDSLRNLAIRPDETVGVYYLWNFKSPLRLFMEQSWRNDTPPNFFTQWASMAPLYSAYGRYLILKHPWPFIKHFLWPNMKRFYAPPAQFMGMYNLGRSRVDPIAVKWFSWQSNKLVINTTSKEIQIANIFTIFAPVINLTFISGLLSFVALGGFKKSSKPNKQIIRCTTLIWICNMTFSTISAPIELRYQLFSLIITMYWAIIFTAYIVLEIFKTTELDNTIKNKISAEIPI